MDKVDAFVLDQMKTNKFPGMAVGIYRYGQLFFARGYGVTNLQSMLPVMSTTTFRLSSVTKQFTAAAILLLFQDGLLRLHDSLSIYFPDAPNWAPVTIHHLLTHTSGIADYFDSPKLDLQREYTENELVDFFKTLPVDLSQLGRNWSYSNTGYVLLGIIIGRLSGVFWSDFLRQRIFIPLAMHQTRTIGHFPIETQGYTDGHTLASGQSITFNDGADGGIYSTVEDMVKWDASLYTNTILSVDSVALLRTGFVAISPFYWFYGYGWFVRKQATPEFAMVHGGGSVGFSSFFGRIPEKGWSILVLANSESQKPFGLIAKQILTLVTGQIPPI